jgi:hypothetical protein
MKPLTILVADEMLAHGSGTLRSAMGLQMVSATDGERAMGAENAALMFACWIGTYRR